MPQIKKDQATPANPPGLRWRGSPQSEVRAGSRREGCSWEIWAMSQLEEKEESLESRPLWTPEEELVDGEHLMISGLGPMLKLGTGSVAVGFGQVIKVLSAGHEHFDNATNRLTTDNLMNLTNRRRKGTGFSRTRVIF